MLKLLICLLIVSQVYCEDDLKPRFKDDEVDITNFKPIANKDKTTVDNKEIPKDLPNDKTDEIDVKTEGTDEKIPKYDEKDTKTGGSGELEPRHQGTGNVPEPGLEDPNTKKHDKPLGSEPDIDLGDEYKKVSINDKNVNKDKTDKDFDNKGVDSENRDKEEKFDPNNRNYGTDSYDTGADGNKGEGAQGSGEDDKKYGGAPGGGEDDKKYGGAPGGGEDDKKYGGAPGGGEDDKKYGGAPGGGEDDKKYGGAPDGGADYNPDQNKGVGSDGKYKEVENGNQIMDQLLSYMKRDYRSEFEKVKLSDVDPIKHGRWGSVTLHDGVVTGLQNIQREGNVVIIDEFGGRKLIVADVVVKDIYADYKVDAKLFHRISIKNRELKLSLEKALLTVRLEVDKNEKKLIIKDLNLKFSEGFSIKSGRLFWPFNKLTNSILETQEHVIKDLISKEIAQYMGKVIHNIQFEEVFAKLF